MLASKTKELEWMFLRSFSTPDGVHQIREQKGLAKAHG